MPRLILSHFPRPDLPVPGDPGIARLADAARLVAIGRPKAEVMALLGCSRSTLWRLETRPGPFRTRLAAERAAVAGRLRARLADLGVSGHRAVPERS